MKEARGETRKLLIVIGKLQDKIGMARALHEADTNPDGFVNAQNLLTEAFDLCIETTGRYYQVDSDNPKG